MGLKFNKLEAVEFGDIKVTPIGTTELKLRVQLALENSKTKEGIEELTDVLASFFPEKKAEVKSFIEANMTLDDMAILAAYLISGNDGVARVRGAMGESK